MDFTLLHRSGFPRIILFFSGWSAEPSWMTGMNPGGYDLAVVSDYRDESDSHSIASQLKDYKEICLVAWSFGVPAATRFLISYGTCLPITRRIAINGTLYPVDDTRGIPEDIFHGTLETLSAATLMKFDRRMCGCSIALERKRDIATLADELRAISIHGALPEMQHLWDTAVISENDMIIPTANQLMAWPESMNRYLVNSPHYPDFKKLFDNLIINKSLVAHRFGTKGSTTYTSNATAQTIIASRVADIMSHITGIDRDYQQWLEIGVGSGLLTERYLPFMPEGTRLTLCDLTYINPDLPGDKIIDDAETMITRIPDSSFDVIAGASVIQWFNSPVRFIEQAVRVLRSGGTAVFSTFAPDTFPELAPYVRRRLSTPTSADYRHYLSYRDVTVDVEEDSITLHFPDSRALLNHISDTGVNSLSGNPSDAMKSARSILRSAVVTLTYRPIFITLRRH